MMIGKSVPRLDAVQKATGQGKYVEDLIPQNAYYAAVVHSTIANGYVRDIDIDEALKMPNVVDVVTCFDVPRKVYSTAGHPFSLDPNHQDVVNRTILSSRVRYYGEEIAVVVAKNSLDAHKAAEKVKVTYEELEPALDPTSAHAAQIPIHEDTPTNELARMDFHIDQDKTVTWETADFEPEGAIDGEESLQAVNFHVPKVQDRKSVV